MGNPMFRVSEKLKLLQVELKKMNSSDLVTFHLVCWILYKRQLEIIQNELVINPSDSAKQERERVLYKQFLTLARQMSKVQWLKLKDQCTSFFVKQ